MGRGPRSRTGKVEPGVPVVDLVLGVRTGNEEDGTLGCGTGSVILLPQRGVGQVRHLTETPVSSPRGGFARGSTANGR